MKLQFKKRRLIPVALAILVLVVGSGVAYAYWTAGGSGSGTGSAAAGTVPVTAYQTTLISGMYPGDVAQTLSGDFTNTNSGPVYVTSVTASIFSVTGGAGTCDASDFLIGGLVGDTHTQTVAVGATIAVAPIIHTGAWTGITIQFNNKATNQDGCKGALVTLHYLVL